MAGSYLDYARATWAFLKSLTPVGWAVAAVALGLLWPGCLLLLALLTLLLPVLIPATLLALGGLWCVSCLGA